MRCKALLTDAQRDEFVDLWCKVPNDEICRHFGLTLLQVNNLRNAIHNTAKSIGDKATAEKLGRKPKRLWRPRSSSSPWNDELERQTLEMLQIGMSSKDIAEVLGFSKQYIRVKLSELRKRYGDEVVGKVDRSAIAREYTPIDGHDYNALYEAVPWQCRISGRCQEAGIPR